MLHYYTDERCTTLKGTYIIGPDTVIETASDIDGREHVISVTSQKVSGKVEPLFVALDTQHEQSQWLFALEEVALRHRYAIDMPWYTTSQPSAFQCDRRSTAASDLSPSRSWRSPRTTRATTWW